MQTNYQTVRRFRIEDRVPPSHRYTYPPATREELSEARNAWATAGVSLSLCN